MVSVHGTCEAARLGWLESMDSKGLMLSAHDGIHCWRDARQSQGGNCLHCVHPWAHVVWRQSQVAKLSAVQSRDSYIAITFAPPLQGAPEPNLRS